MRRDLFNSARFTGQGASKARDLLGEVYEYFLGAFARAEGKLSNPGFLSKAPANLVAAEKDKLEKNRQMLVALDARIAELG